MTLVENVDVVIIGAGFSGLYAALLLKEKGVNSVAVIDSNNRVGGRIFSTEIRGIGVDVGGQWVGPQQDVVLKVISDLSLETHKQHYQGKRILDFDGRMMTYTTDLPRPMGILGVIDLQILLWRIEYIRKQVPPDAPEKCSKAYQWDSVSCAHIISQWAKTAQVKKMLFALVRGIFGCEPSEVSFLHFLAYVNSAGGVENLATIKDGFQDRTILGGAQQIANKLAEQLRKTDSIIQLNTTVNQISQDNQWVYIEGKTLNDETLRYKCRVVIIAVPPSIIAQKITFNPPLPDEKIRAMKQSFIGCMIKILICYDEPFWRKKGFSGEALCDISNGPLFNAYDHTLQKDGKAIACLVAFISGASAREWSDKTKEERREAVLKQLSRWFGEEALHPIEYVEKDWLKDPHTGGCPVGIWPTGVLSQYSQMIRQPFGHIFFAGTETAPKSQGYMDGALRSGQIIAEKVFYFLQTGEVQKEEINERLYYKLAHQKISCSSFCIFTFILKFILFLLAVLGLLSIFYEF